MSKNVKKVMEIGHIIADFSGIPFSTKLSKLAEELLKCEEGMKRDISELKSLQTGKLLGYVGASQQALAYYPSADMSEDMRHKQLMRARCEFQDAYFRVKLVDKLKCHQSAIAMNIAICHHLQNHPIQSREWLGRSLADHNKYSSIYNPAFEELQRKLLMQRLANALREAYNL